MSINQVERAFRAWPILIKTAKKRETITYLQLGNALGIHHRAIRYVLGVIQDYCLEENLPPLTILIVNSSGKPGGGFIAYDLRKFEDGLEEVFSFDWSKLDNPFSFSNDGYSYKSITDILVNEPDSSGEIYAKVKSRGIKQMLFRDALLKAYSYKCAFTDISFTQGLEAAHIVPWKYATDDQRLDVRNGILLNSFHHKLFDSGVITISTDYEITYFDPDEESDDYSEMDRILSSQLHGKLMRLPNKKILTPLTKFIEVHHRLHDWEF